MSKAQTDIRSTSYDAASANPYGYVGTIDDAIAQIRAAPEPRWERRPRGRTELRVFLGVPPKHLSVSTGPSVELDQGVWYGADDRASSLGLTLGIFDPGFYGLSNAKSRGWI